MNILLVSSKYMPEYSGSGFRAHNLYKRLTALYPEIFLNVLTCSVEFNDCAEYDFDGFKVSRIACKRFTAQAGSGKLYNLFKNAANFEAERKAALDYFRHLDKKPNLIHIFGESYVSATALEYAGENKIPVLIELCNEMANPWHYVPFPFSMFVSGKPAHKYKFVCISERLKKICLSNGVKEQNIWCRPNPINETLFKPVSPTEKAKLKTVLTGFEPQSKILSWIAKFIPRKNHIFLLDVMRHLPPEFKLFLGGPLVETGPNVARNRALFDEIASRIQSEGLQARVRLEHGFCKNIQEYYQMSDVYLFPTKAEGLGTPMLEAVASGVPVVVNRIEGTTDSWISDGRNGYLSNLDPKEFADKILKAAQIPGDILKEESQKILAVAATSVIDSKYYEIMKELIDR